MSIAPPHSDPAPSIEVGAARSAVTSHRQPFSAVIRRGDPAPQHDSVVDEEPSPAVETEAPVAASRAPEAESSGLPSPSPAVAGPREVPVGDERETASAPPPDLAPAMEQAAGPVPSGEETASGERPEGRTVHLPDSEAPSAAAAPQADSIASVFGYRSKISETGVPDPGEFGTTRPRYLLKDVAATQNAGAFNVTGAVDAQITFAVAGGIRADIASDSDPDITQANYPDVVKDLTPSPNAVNTRTVKLMKNQPPRTRFWAKDLTIDHETFHADEDVKFGQEGTALAQQWLNTRTANTYEQVWAHLPNAIQMVATHVDIAMSYPGRETRAYNDGAPAYTARAQAIKTKGDAKGYVPRPPAPRTPASPPVNPPTPSPTPAPAPKESAPK